MASHFECVGFDVPDENSFRQLVERAAHEGRSLETPGGTYIVWAAGGGAELWVQVQDGGLLGANPHFTGEGRIPVAITAFVPNPQYRMDGSLHAWAAPQQPDVPDTGVFPFLVDSPEFLAVRQRISLLSPVALQVAAFAHEIQCFPDEIAYKESQANDRPGFASRSFIPTGLFATEGDTSRAHAFLTGHILKAERCINDSSGLPFWWLLVDSLEGTFDVVAAPKSLREEPRVGGIAQGNFWLSGRVIETP